MLSVLSKMAARNCIFVKCFFEKTQKSAPLQLNFECSGVFWLNLVTLGTASLSMYFRERRPEFLKQALYYFGIILFFALGAGAGGNLSVRYGVHVIWVSGGLLMVSVLLMFLEKLRVWNR